MSKFGKLNNNETTNSKNSKVEIVSIETIDISKIDTMEFLKFVLSENSIIDDSDKFTDPIYEALLAANKDLAAKYKQEKVALINSSNNSNKSEGACLSIIEHVTKGSVNSIVNNSLKSVTFFGSAINAVVQDLSHNQLVTDPSTHFCAKDKKCFGRHFENWGLVPLWASLGKIEEQYTGRNDELKTRKVNIDTLLTLQISNEKSDILDRYIKSLEPATKE